MKPIAARFLRETFETILPATALLAAIAFIPALAAPKEFSLGTENEQDFRPAVALASPHPEIPSEMHEECFKSCCIARFLIKQDGKFDVKLLTSTGNEDLDEIALKTLKQWKFRPATLNGEPVPSTRRIKIQFEVE
jgi:protein TonB